MSEPRTNRWYGLDAITVAHEPMKGSTNSAEIGDGRMDSQKIGKEKGNRKECRPSQRGSGSSYTER